MKLVDCFVSLLFFFLSCLLTSDGNCAVEFPERFAPHQGFISAYEKPIRQELCLNGKWAFQPIDIPQDYKWGIGDVPDLPLPDNTKWESVPVKVPSAWNVNMWGMWREPGKYDPVPLYYPSYPDKWRNVSMGWLSKDFIAPDTFKNKRIILHFNGIAGESKVIINGTVAVESHYDTFTPFEVDVTDLISFSDKNNILVGVRKQRLFNKKHANYHWGWEAMGPNGSYMFDLCGIYQDVYLVALPNTHIENVFVKPDVEKDTLTIDYSIINTSKKDLEIELQGNVCEWQNKAGDTVLEAPVEKWELSDTVMELRSKPVTISAGSTKTISIQTTVNGYLKLWDMNNPNLYGLVTTVKDNFGKEIDKQYTRFGWREFKVTGSDLHLNGKPVKLYGDILHPFSQFIMTRRTAWAWFTMIKDFGGNAVRLHAQPWPKFYIDMADEMGLAVLDETAIFGSSGGFNMDEPQAWKNCEDHYKALILRDRNSPSVFGWSFGNEMFAVFSQLPTAELKNKNYDRLAELGNIASTLDPTRNWISCDGDETLEGRIKIWSKHWGDNWLEKQHHSYKLPEDESLPVMLGEFTGSYYGLPHWMDYMLGDHTHKTYAGRVDAMGIDIYEMLTQMGIDKLDYFSASETVWFGLEHISLGYNDYTRLPNENDGVFLTAEYTEGLPGSQPERIPPFVTTLNPGWDSSLELYYPLGMFNGLKAALHGEPYMKRTGFLPRPAIPAARFDKVGYIGDKDSLLSDLLNRCRINIDNNDQAYLIMADSVNFTKNGSVSEIEKLCRAGKTIMFFIPSAQTDISWLKQMLDTDIELTDRSSSNFVPGTASDVFAPLTLEDMFLVEPDHNRYVSVCGIGGEFLNSSKSILEASNIDWALFNVPEDIKCGSLQLFERLKKPSGVVMAHKSWHGGHIILTTLDYNVRRNGIENFWQKLFACLKVNISGQPINDYIADPNKRHDLLMEGPVD